MMNGILRPFRNCQQFFKNKLNNLPNLNYKESVEDALKSISADNEDIILITGSLYLAGEVLNLN